MIEVTRSGEVVWGVGVDEPHSARRLDNGNTLVVAGTTVYEVAADTSVVWMYDFAPYCIERSCQGRPQDAVRLDNGHTLISVNDSAIGLIEVDQSGSVVAEHQVTDGEGTGLPVYSAQLLANGNWLATGSGITRARVVELTSSGAQQWYYGPSGFCDGCLYLPRDSVRTSRGTTLIADYGKDRILEVDADGEIIWRYSRESAGPWSIREVPK